MSSSYSFLQMSTSIPFTYALLLVPIAQVLLSLVNRRWIVIPISGLMFYPAWAGIVQIVSMESGEIGVLERWEFVYLVTGRSWPILFLGMLVGSLISLLLWVFISQILYRKLRPEKPLRLPVAKVYVLVLTALLAALLSLRGYDSLEHAVESNDLALASRRLKFNLEGLGPNDGRINSFGTYGLVRSPLLPVAVKNDNKQMVELLLEYGADLNPKNPNDKSTLESRIVTRNALAVAIRYDNMPMLSFLVQEGANPTQGLTPAAIQGKVVLFQFLVNRGADVDVCRRELTARGEEEMLDKMLVEVKSPPE